MPKVLHIITGLSIGGAERMLTRLIERTDRARLSSVVVSLTTGPTGAPVDGTPVFTLNMRPGVPDPRALLALGRIIASERPDVVQTWLYHADLMGLLAAKWKHAGALAWNVRCASLSAAQSSRGLIAVRTVLSRLSRVPDVVVTNSEAGRLAHEAYGYRPRRWVLIPNGFDITVLRPDATRRARKRAELGIGPAAPVIAMIARLHPIKDHETFFAASADLLRTNPDVVFVLAGMGLSADNRHVRTYFDRFKLNLASYRLRGCQDHIEQLLPACDLCTLTSTSEGFPNAIGEAMACGVPCIATDAGDSARVIGKAGTVVPIRRPAELADAWRQFLRLDTTRKGALGEEARRRIVQDFSIDSVAAQYADLHEELATLASRRPR